MAKLDKAQFKEFKAKFAVFAKEVAEKLPGELQKIYDKCKNDKRMSSRAESKRWMEEYAKLFGDKEPKAIEFTYIVSDKGKYFGDRKLRGQIRAIKERVDYFEIMVNINSGKLLTHINFPAVSGGGTSLFIDTEMRAFVKQNSDILLDNQQYPTISVGGMGNPWKYV